MVGQSKSQVPADPDQGAGLTHNVEERRLKIALLLSTMDDYLPGLGSSSPAALPGPAASRYVPCDLCQQKGRLKDDVLCPECHGSRWRRRRAGEREWDAYLEQAVEDAVAPTRNFTGTPDHAANIRALDASIERIQRTLDAKEGKHDDGFRWERVKKSYWRAGSYKALTRWLNRMQRERPDLRMVVRRHYELELPGQDVEPVIDWLEERMPKSLRVPPWVMERYAQRNQVTVEQLRAEGLGAGAIAKRLRMSKKKVRRLLAKQSRGL